MIIATKLHIPRQQSALVARPRLLYKLDDGLHKALTLITAPAGYGKTVLLSEWTASIKEAVSWVSIDERDNDRMRFWRHTIAALKQALPTFDDQAVLRHASDATGDSLIAALINGLNRITQPIVLVWDDFHHMKEPLIIQGVIYLIERMPAHVHLYIASRTIPSLSLSRIRAANGLIRLGVSELRFAYEETISFFALRSGSNISAEEATIIQKRTEGWPVAMQLAILSLDQHEDPALLVQKMTGMERDISDYFFEEVFLQQTESVQRFLLQTSILERMTEKLCAVVTRMTDSAGYLLQLEQDSLFVIPLDGQRQWYRYHHLFQQFLIDQLKLRQAERWKDLHIAAGAWLEENGFASEAMEHYLVSENYSYALSLLETLSPELMSRASATLCTWLSAIPEEQLRMKPMLLLTKYAAQYLSGQTQLATEGYWRSIRWLEGEGSNDEPGRQTILQAGLAFLAAIRTFMDRDFDYAVQFSQEYVERHPQGDFFIGFGRDEDGYHPIWDIYVSDNSLILAEQILVPLLSIWSTTENKELIAHLSIDFGKLLYERNQLQEAAKYMRQAYEISELYQNASLRTIALLWIARIAAAQGDWQSANDIIGELTKQKLSTNSHLAEKVLWVQAVLAKMQGDKHSVNQWIYNRGLQSSDEIPLAMIAEYNLLGLLLADEGKLEAAIDITDRILLIVHQIGQQSDRVRLFLHKSIYLSMQEKIESSMDILEEVLELAQAEGYIRTFIDEGAPLKRLLDQYISLRQTQQWRSTRQISLSYVKKIRRLCFSDEHILQEQLLSSGKLAVLTPKEQEVLRCMDRGITNKQIAEQLHVSLSTIKTHVNNIYSKLQVKNRLQALERARTLRLF